MNWDYLLELADRHVSALEKIAHSLESIDSELQTLNNKGIKTRTTPRSGGLEKYAI